jgi:hypothetical protein
VFDAVFSRKTEMPGNTAFRDELIVMSAQPGAAKSIHQAGGNLKRGNGRLGQSDQTITPA